jgi:hypothetical protein
VDLAGSETTAVAPVPVKKVGDDSLGYRLTIHTGVRAGSSFEYITVRVGNGSLTIRECGSKGPDQALIHRLVTTGVSKLDAVIQAARK